MIAMQLTVEKKTNFSKIPGKKKYLCQKGFSSPKFLINHIFQSKYGFNNLQE